MTGRRLHLVRHGEVHNPGRILYGRLPDFHLSEAGRQMADAAAAYIASLDRPVSLLRCSPLERTQESAAPFAERFGLTPELDERVIEPSNVFEGTQMHRALLNPLNWRHLRRPSRPSWGEPYLSIAQRMTAAMDDAWDAASDGDVVIVSHQAPIWVTHLHVAGLPYKHDPRSRRCALSSVTSFTYADGKWQEIGYAEPALTGDAVDVGAV
ncbi:histidine phosphatase family protein [Microbacterium sp. NIBRBAC000506063]|uniref:histidine phosphatase family protein n=1 Tax=Microbacterium sp. NIBRBAC000506063 TaxID=2734618 RepID=UPI001BB53744|nr:histidine phosphatase family protein [Microbacterium sp. NIBRBAC000506063]QTV80106.1 histidine phosphatase family protein [Microbacterium sp. NIBRBAC000506063]